MMPRCWQLGTLSLWALLACGCAWRQCCPGMPCAGPATLDCQEVERQTITPDVSAVPPRSSVTFDQRRYCHLPECEAQCLAASNAPLARLLEQEAEALGT